MKQISKPNNYVSKWVGDILHIYDFVYRQNYYFISAATADEAVAVVKKGLNVDIVVNPGINGFFKAIYHDRTKCLLSLIWAVDDDDIVHEISHAVAWNLDHCGIPHNVDTDEAYAYYTSFLYNEIFKNKRKTNDK